MMLKLKTYKNQKINIENLVQILFYALPLSFIIGNAAISIHSIIFICLSFFLIKQKELNLRFNYTYWILIIFFSYLIINTFINFNYPGLFWNTFVPAIELNNAINTDLPGDLDLSPDKDHWISKDNDPFLKSLIATRFLLLFIVISVLFYNKILDLKKFFLSSLICTTFVSVDILFQYTSGKNFLGLVAYEGYYTGFFGEEKIATAYLKNFSLFSFFYIFQNIKNKNLNNFISILIIVIHLSAALFSGNRMPMLLFLFGYILLILFVKNFRLIMSLSLIIFISVFLYTIKNNSSLKHHYAVFLNTAIVDVFKSIKNVGEKNIKKGNEEKEDDLTTSSPKVPKDIIFLRHSGHNRIMRAGIEVWKEGFLTGFGINSFRMKCFEILIKDNKKRKGDSQKISCGNHPHNYYLELLAETGIIGFSFVLLFSLILIKNSLTYFLNNKKTDPNIILLAPIIIVFFLEIWPIRSSGSFFTTWNATFFWICASILMGYRIKKL